MSKNILVTGAGGDIGQSIGKCLEDINIIGNKIGTDLSLKNCGKFIFDRMYKVPRCDDSNYLAVIESLIEKESIDLILPMSEPEIRFFNSYNIDKIGKSLLIKANKYSVEIGSDKYKTSKFLETNAWPFPRTSYEDISDEVGFPLIAKDNHGCGSKDLFILNDKEEVRNTLIKHPQHIIQEFLSEEKGEYTCGLFRSSKGDTRSIVFKRKLTGGYSGYGELVEDENTTDLLHKLAYTLNLVGSINVQLRIHNNKPTIFEINPRFSSTVRFRHMLGFKDVLWSIEDILNNPISEYIPPMEGSKFYKGYSEYIETNKTV